MKIELELKEKTVSNMNINNSDTYTGWEYGLYLINDGRTFFLVNWDGNYPMSFPILNKEIIDQYVSEKSMKCKEDLKGTIIRDYNKLLAKFSGIEHALEQILESSASECTINNQQLDIRELTNMIAVAQKPELLKDV